MKKLILLLFIIIGMSANSQEILQPGYYLNTVDIIYKVKKDTFQGIDVSFYQGKINWSNIDSNISFAICKASEGVKIVDSKFNYNWENCKLVKGAYHFFRPQFSGDAQGKIFLSIVPFDSGNIVPVIDVEMTSYWNRPKNRKKGAENLSKMVSYVEEQTGETPIIYTTTHFWDKYVRPYYTMKGPLWIADFRSGGPQTPKDKTDWVIWQFCINKVKGINKKVDKNICVDLKKILIK